MPDRSKIAFIKLGPFSHINESVLRALQTEFPESEFDVIDVRDLVDFKSLPNVIRTAVEYGGQILLRGKPPGDCLEKSAYIFRRIKDAFTRRLSTGEYLFSFQTQSRFDASVPGLPHYVYTDHTHLANLTYPDIRPRDLFPSRWIRREKTIYENATMVFTMSRHVTKSLLEGYELPAEKVECVFAGSNTGIAKRPPSRKEPGKTILFVGVEWERKGGADLAAAFPKVRETHPDARLVIVGCSPDLAGLENCEIAGKIPLEEVERYYGEADVFCLPSRIEPFGIAFIEAMLHRLPIVATDIGAIPDMVIPGETGELCPPGDAGALAAALIEMLDDPGRHFRYGERGEALAQARYSWKSVGKNLHRNITRSLG